MADKNARKRCLKELVNCDNISLPDLGLCPWNLPSAACQPKSSSSSTSIMSEIRKRVACCVNLPRPRYKNSLVSESFFPVTYSSKKWNDRHMGEGTHRVPMSLFGDNRKRLCEALRTNKDTPPNAVVFLQGGAPVNHYNTDIEYLFRQEPYFHWTFGVSEANCYGAIVVSTGYTVLFVPRLPESYATWMGPLKTCEEFKEIYEVDNVQYSDQVIGDSVEKTGKTIIYEKEKRISRGTIDFDVIDPFP